MKQTIKIIFTISILLNVVLIGVVGGGAYKRYQHHQEKSLAHSGKMDKMLREKLGLSLEYKKAYMKKKEGNLKKLQSLMQEDEFDRGSYDEVMQRILESKNEMAKYKAKSMGDALSSLPKEERADVSKFMLKKLSGRHGRRGEKR